MKVHGEVFCIVIGVIIYCLAIIGTFLGIAFLPYIYAILIAFFGFVFGSHFMALAYIIKNMGNLK